ncbi:hypothetical protein BC938DRAFT_479285 [Jimgerdemannia flammicorona]|uniref:Uncharacterized protein n=1 Tax=Jimgerdemannia flammicorona TaxID=994334 RepID=A0A433QL61_9FUNG|nr:hypothetical protein BC938DRAFT_479285 [Jimgerdemannia flammicorona]
MLIVGEPELLTQVLGKYCGGTNDVNLNHTDLQFRGVAERNSSLRHEGTLAKYAATEVNSSLLRFCEDSKQF